VLLVRDLATLSAVGGQEMGYRRGTQAVISVGDNGPGIPKHEHRRIFDKFYRLTRDDLAGLMALERAAADRLDPPREVVTTRSVWDAAIEAYYAEHDTLDTAADARSPKMLAIEPTTGQPAGVGEDDPGETRIWRVRQTLADPEGHHDWVIDAIADLDASDEAGELVLATTAMHRL